VEQTKQLKSDGMKKIVGKNFERDLLAKPKPAREVKTIRVEAAQQVKKLSLSTNSSVLIDRSFLVV
jgi:hypothetical protein